MERGTAIRLILVGLAISLIVLAAAALVGFIRGKPAASTLTKKEFIKELKESLFGKSYLLKYRFSVSDKKLGVTYNADILIDSSGRGVLLVQSKTEGSMLGVLIVDKGDYIEVCKILKTITLKRPIAYTSKLLKKNLDILAIALGSIPLSSVNFYSVIMMPILLGKADINGSIAVFKLNATNVHGYAIFEIGNVIMPLRIHLVNGTVTVDVTLVKKENYNPLIADTAARTCALS